MARIAKELKGQKRAHRLAGGNHLEPGIRWFHQLIEGDLGQIRQEEEQAPESSSGTGGRQVQLAHIATGETSGRVPGGRSSSRRRGRRVNPSSFRIKEIAAGLSGLPASSSARCIVDGQVLLSQRMTASRTLVHLGDACGL